MKKSTNIKPKRPSYILFLKVLRTGHVTLMKFPEWIERVFPQSLVLHPRAVRELKDIQPNAFDLPLLCDALEFLGTEYHQQLLNHLNSDEVNQCYHIKYQRPFDVTPNKGVVQSKYADQYHVVWKGKTGGWTYTYAAAIQHPISFVSISSMMPAKNVLL